MEVEPYRIEVALPDETPIPLNLSKLPPDVLRSQCLDLALRQCEELFARLSVTLKRNLRLEEQIFSLEELVSRLRKECDVMTDEVEVLREQDRKLRERNAHLERSTDDLKQGYSQNEIQLSELNLKLEEKVERLKLTVAELHKRCQRYENYRIRIKKRVRPFARGLRLDREELKIQLEEKVKEYRELQARFSETISHFQTTSREREQDLRNLNDEFEKRIQSLTEDKDQLKDRNAYLEEKMAIMQQVIERNAQLENQLVQLRREARGDDQVIKDC